MQRDFEEEYGRAPYSIHSPEQVAFLQSDIAGGAEEYSRSPFEAATLYRALKRIGNRVGPRT